MPDFKTKYTFVERYNEATKIKKKYPDRIPIIVETGPEIELDKHKYLVPMHLTVGQLIYVIRRRIRINDPAKAIYVFINNKLHMHSDSINIIYQNNKDNDNFLYACVKYEHTFG